MKNDVLETKDNEKSTLSKQELNDDEMKEVKGGFVLTDSKGVTINANPDYIIREINNGNLENIKRLIAAYMFSYWVSKQQVYEMIKNEFNAAGKQIPASLKEFLES